MKRKPITITNDNHGILGIMTIGDIVHTGATQKQLNRLAKSLGVPVQKYKADTALRIARHIAASPYKITLTIPQ